MGGLFNGVAAMATSACGESGGRARHFDRGDAERGEQFAVPERKTELVAVAGVVRTRFQQALCSTSRLGVDGVQPERLPG